MNKKQVESLKNYMIMIVEHYHNTQNGQEITKALNKIDSLLKLMFDTYMITDYKEVEKIRKEIIQAGLDKLTELQKAENIA